MSEPPEADIDDGKNSHSDKGRTVRSTNEARSKTVYHEEKRIYVRKIIPDAGQPIYRIKGAGQKSQWCDDKIGYRRNMVVLVGPDAPDKPEKRQHQRRHKGEIQNDP